jgi:VCBS repeat-containing protein
LPISIGQLGRRVMTNPTSVAAAVVATSTYAVDPLTRLPELGVASADVAHGVLSNVAEPNGKPLAVTAVSGANGSGTAGQIIAGAHGILIVEADGSYRYLLTDASGATSSPLQDVFTITASDGSGGTATAQLDVTIDRAPVANDVAVAATDLPGTTITASAAQGVLGGVIVAGHTLSVNATDADGDTLSVVTVKGAGGTVAAGQAVAGADGTLTLNADGSYSYQVTKFTINPGTFQPIEPPTALHDTFTYVVSDGNGGTTTAALEIGLGAVVALNSTAVVTGGIGATTGGEALLTENAGGGDGNLITSLTGANGGGTRASGGAPTSITAVGTHGNLMLTAGGIAPYIYTVTNLTGAFGSPLPDDIFTYTMSDGQGHTDTATIDIKINRNPIAGNDTAIAAAVVGATLSADAAHSVLSNDTDPDGRVLAITAVSGANGSGAAGAAIAGANGNLTLNADGSYTYVVTSPAGTPAADGRVHDVFTYTESDGNGTASATLDIALDPSLTIAPPTANHSASVTASSTYTVDPVSGLPDLGVVSADVARGLLSNVAEPNGKPLAVTAVSGANGTGTVGQTIAGAHGVLVVQADGSYRYVLTDAAGATGSPLQDVFTFTASDGSGGTVTAQLDVTIDRPPVANDVAVAATDLPGTTITASAAQGVLGGVIVGGHTLSVNATDADGDTLSVESVTGAGGMVAAGQAVAGTYGTLTLNADGSYTYKAKGFIDLKTLQPDEPPTAAHDVFTYVVSDGNGGTTTATLNVGLGAVVAENSATTVTGGIGATTGGEALLTEDDGGGNANLITSLTGANGGGTRASGGAPTSITAVGTHGNLMLTAGGLAPYIYTVTNLTGASGSPLPGDIFTYTMSDGQGHTDTATIDIKINRNPIAANDTASATGVDGATVSADAAHGVLSNDTDPDGHVLAITGISGANGSGAAGAAIAGANGNLTLNAAGSYTYVVTSPAGTPAADGHVHDVFTYTESDGNGSATATLDIALIPPLAGHATAVTATEGVALTSPVATFTDTSATDAPSAFTATVTWGDGATSAGTVTGGNGSFTVSGGHTYADEGSFALSTTVTRTGDGATVTLGGAAATVADADTLTAQPVTFAAGPNQAFSGVVANFTDSNMGADPADLTASIQWGDGTTTAGTITGSNGTFAVSGTHTYTAAGPKPVAVTISDPGGAATTTTSEANVIAITPLTSGQPIAETRSTEFDFGVFVEAVTNPSTQVGITIDWGDGTTSTENGVPTTAGNNFQLLTQHTYQDEGSFPVTLQITSPDVSATVQAGTVTVDDSSSFEAQPSTTTIIANPGQTFSGTLASFQEMLTQPGTTIHPVTDFTAAIAWGDGTTSAGTISGFSGDYTVSGTHTYTSAGLDTITVSLSDDGSGGIKATTQETANVGLTPASAVANTPFSFGTSFIEANVTGGITATIDWGDGTTSAGTIFHPSVDVFNISGTHTYATQGTFLRSVEIIAPDVSGSLQGIVTVAAPVVSGQTVAVSATEGAALTGTSVATFTDTETAELPSAFTATITWGDGATSAGTVTGGNGSFTVSGDHTYADEGSFALSTTVTRTGDGTTVTLGGAAATVAEADALTAQPITFAANPNQAFSGGVANFTDTNTAAAAADLTATINWGDGATTAGTVSGGNGTFAVAGAHTYTSAGLVPVTVTLADDAPGSASATAHSTADVDSDTLVTISTSVTIPDGAAQTFTANLTGTGSIAVQSTGDPTSLVVDGTLTVQPGGHITLSDNTNNFIVSDGASATLTNQSTIAGAGTLGGGLVVDNAALINATGINPLTIEGNGALGNPGSVNNQGTMQGSGTGGLILGGAIDNTGGIIAALNGSLVDLTGGASLGGGIVDTSVGGALATVTGSAALGNLAGFNNAGQVIVRDGTALHLNGASTLNNTGTITLAAAGDATNLVIGAGSLQLEGNGAIGLSDDSHNTIAGDGISSHQLANPGNTISGAGTLGGGLLDVENGGLINATGINALTIVGNSAGTGGTGGGFNFFNNQGRLQASGAGGLVLESTIGNAGGVVTALAGSLVALTDGVSLGGGIVDTSVGGALETVTGSAALGNLAGFNNAGQVIVKDGTALHLNGASTLNNTGTITLAAAGDATNLVIGAGSLQLQGNGAIGLSDDSHNTIAGDGISSHQLANADNTISGAGTLGGGLLDVENGGLINATGINALTIVGNSATGGTGGGGLNFFNNQGRLQASGSGGLILESTIGNAGGVVTALAGSLVALTDGTSLGGGIVDTSVGGALETVTGSAALGNLAGFNNAGQVIVRDGTALHLNGASTLNNTGTITLAAAGDATNLVIGAGSLQLQGNGAIGLSDDSHNTIAGDGISSHQLVNTGNTISGAGTLGGGLLDIENGGLINATGANALTIIGNSAGTGGTGGAGGGFNFFNNQGTVTASGAGGVIVQGDVGNTGLMQAGAGSAFTVTGAVHGLNGSLTLAANATFELGGANAEAMTFTGADARLKFDQPASVTGPIQGLVLGDIIDLANTAVTSDPLNGGVLTVNTSSGPLTYQVAGDLAGNFFKIESDNAGGTDLVLTLSPVTVSASISGTPQDGRMLSAVVSTNDSAATIHYQWQRVDTHGVVTNVGADSPTYQVQEGDEGQQIDVMVTAIDPTSGATGSATSPLTGLVTDIPPTLSVALSGNAIEGQTLTATPTIGSDGDGGTIKYVWQSAADGIAFTPIAGAANSAIYVVGEGDEGRVIRVEATFTDDTGQTTAPADSNVSARVTDPAPTLTVALAGSAVEGATLTATPTIGSDGDGGTIKYVWQSSADGVTFAPIAGAANSAIYVLADGDENRTVRVEATFTDDTGQAVTADSNATTPVKDVAPTLSVAIAGKAIEGQTLTATPTTGSDGDGGTIKYVWQSSADGVTFAPIAGAPNSATYVVGEGDEGRVIRVEATFTDDTGQSTAPADSNASARVTDPAPTLSVAVGGKAIQGQTLTATPTIGSDGDGGTIHYQWQSSTDGSHWSNITGANAATYLIQQPDGGHELRVEATFTDDTSQSVIADSAATAPVAAMAANPERLVVSEGIDFLPIANWLLANDSSPFGSVHVTAVDGRSFGLVQLAPGYEALVLPDGHGGDQVYLSVDEDVVAKNAMVAPDITFTYTASDGIHSAVATDRLAAVRVGQGGIDLTSSAIGPYDFSAIAGSDGNETLSGGAGVDLLVGGDGRNTITGGAGGDILVGDGPAVFRYTALSDSRPGFTGSLANFDTVVNFDPDADRFDFSAIAGIANVAPRSIFSAGSTVDPHSIAWFFDRPDNQTILYVNASGAAEHGGATDMEIHLAGQVDLRPGDFILSGGKTVADSDPDGNRDGAALFAAPEPASILQLVNNTAANLAPASAAPPLVSKMI